MSRTIWRKVSLLGAGSVTLLGGGCIGLGGLGGDGLFQTLLTFAFDSLIFRVVN